MPESVAIPMSKRARALAPLASTSGTTPREQAVEVIITT